MLGTLVDRKEFNRRIRVQIAKVKSDMAAARRRASSGPGGFAANAGTIIRLNVHVRVLHEVLRAKSTTTVEEIQLFAIRRVLVLAEETTPDANELSAWAIVVDLTRAASLRARA